MRAAEPSSAKNQVPQIGLLRQGPNQTCGNESDETSIEGNGNHQQIEWQTHARDEVVTHYSINWDPYASRT